MFTHDLSHIAIDSALLKNTLSDTAGLAGVLMAEKLPLLEHCSRQQDLDEIETLGAAIRNRFPVVVICGMGGSTLSGKMLASLTYNPFGRQNDNTQLLFLDNIGPVLMDNMVASIDFSKTLFIMISKSGGTAETLSHLGIFWHEAEKVMGAKKAAEHFLAITETRDTALRRFAVKHSIRCLEHHPGIGGRYAALTNVGLLPASIAGLDILKVCKGAADTLQDMKEKAEKATAVQGAAISYLLARQGKTITVLFPYCERLWQFALWHRQIWAESLGKNGKGLTPAPALGSVDQHSQLQLYLDGPPDKFFSLILVDRKGKGPAIPPLGDETLSYLEQHTIGDLMDAQQHATVDTLILKKCPVRVISMPDLNEETLGNLTMHFMLETILTGRLMGIDPFDQPAVEDGKKLAIKRLTGTI